MVAAQTLPNLPELTPEQAERWIAAALAEGEALRQHEHQLIPDSDDPNGVRLAEHLRTAWTEWADGADAVLRSVRPLLHARRHVAGAYDLDYAVGRARAMLSITPDILRVRRQQLERGDTLSIEEVRSELRPSDRR